MTENNAAQPGQEFRFSDDQLMAIATAAWEVHSKEAYSPDGLLMACVAVQAALLAKLLAEGVQAGDVRPLIEKLEAWQAVCDRIVDQYGGVVAGVDFAALGRANRAALASAPVAGEAHMPPGYRVKAVDGHGYRITPPTGSDWVAHSDTPAGDLIAALLAAPQASEAVDLSAVSDIALEDEMRKRGAWVAPQADKDGGDCAKGADQPDIETLRRVGAAHDAVQVCPECDIAGCKHIRAALTPTPSVVKQSLTATQTGEKGDGDE